MTADGPDKGTPEYNVANTIKNLPRAEIYYRSFLRNLTDEEKKNFTMQLGKFSKMNTAPFQQFAELTGPLLVKNPRLLETVAAAVLTRRGAALPASFPLDEWAEKGYTVTQQALRARTEQ